MTFRSIVCALVLGTASAGAQAGLIAYYTFEGNANDVSGNANHGAVNGAALTAFGFQGQAYEFDGFNDYIGINVNIDPAFRSKVTFGAWANTDAVNAIRAIVSQDNGGFDRNINVDSRGDGAGYRYSAFTGSGVVSAGPDPAPVGQWVFVAARYDDIANTVTLDVDGSRITASANPGSGFNFTRIGSNPLGGGIEFWDGKIDNVFIYDELLSDAQIDVIRLSGGAAILGNAVPVPATAALLALGLAGFAARRRRIG